MSDPAQMEPAPVEAADAGVLPPAPVVGVGEVAQDCPVVGVVPAERASEEGSHKAAGMGHQNQQQVEIAGYLNHHYNPADVQSSTSQRNLVANQSYRSPCASANYWYQRLVAAGC